MDQASTVHACGEETLMLALLIFSAPSAHSDPVVPILFALVFLTLGVAGCMYGFAGGGLPPNIRTMAILPFENQTASPRIP